MNQDEQDLAHGRLRRLRTEAEEDLQAARCSAKQHVRVFQKWVDHFKSEDESAPKPMQCPSHEELETVARKIQDTKTRLGNLQLGIVDGC